MPAILTSMITIKDLDKMKEYSEQALPTILAHNGEVLFRGQVVRPLRGQARHNFSLAIRFADVAAVDAWFTSPEYAALHDMRDAAADVTFVVHEGL